MTIPLVVPALESDGRRALDLGGRLGLPLNGMRRLSSRRDCPVYRADSDGRTVFVKAYAGTGPEHARQEAAAFDLAHRVGSSLAGWLGARSLSVSPDGRIVCLGAVAGNSLSQALRRARRNQSSRRACLRAAHRLGIFLAVLRRVTAAPGKRPAPHLGEYLHHVAESLAARRLLGRRFRKLPRLAATLWEDLEQTAWTPSFAHGDLTPRNVHVDVDGRVGVIDFAHARALSHPLDDICALRAWLHSTGVPSTLRQGILSEVRCGMGNPYFPRAVERFFLAFHGWRWAHLALASGPASRLRALTASRLSQCPEEDAWTLP